MAYCRFLVAPVTVAVAMLPIGQAAFADVKIAGCHDVKAEEAVKSQVQCDVRATEDVIVKSIKVSGSDRSIDATYKPFKSSEPPTSVLFLVDLAVERADFGRFRAAALQIIDTDAKGLSYGVYGFTRDLRPIAPLGTSPATIKLALDAVASDQRPAPPELLKNIVEVIPLLSASPAERKILIVMSYGGAPETAFAVPEVLERLKQASITVIGIVPRSQPDDLNFAQGLRRLSQDSFGEFLTLPSGAGRRIKDMLSFGGSFSFSPVATDMKIDVDIQNGAPISTNYKTALAPVVDSAPAAGISPSKTINLLNPEEVFAAFVEWLRASLLNQLIFAGAALGFVVVLLLLGRLLSRRAKELEPEVSDSPLDIAPSADIRPVFGWLEFLDGNQTREPIRSRATRIGRNSDNDIVLKNTSVHRQHAVIREDPAGGLVIVDMDTVNGVKVNGERVKSAKLEQNDVIELGEVRMRFSQPHYNS